MCCLRVSGCVATWAVRTRMLLELCYEALSACRNRALCAPLLHVCQLLYCAQVVDPGVVLLCSALL